MTTLREVAQEELVAEWLEKGYSITQLEALDMFGCLRLGARIYRLRKGGMDIITETVKTASGAHIARYRLAPGWKRPTGFRWVQ